MTKSLHTPIFTTLALLNEGTDFRFGSKTEVDLADVDFRFTPQSRHPAVGLACPFSAIS
jgi:hypothetical protein